MAKTKSKEKKLKRLRNQLKARAHQHDMFESVEPQPKSDWQIMTAGTNMGVEMLTRKGRIEAAIKTLENTK
jgi:hypothetical protein